MWTGTVGCKRGMSHALRLTCCDRCRCAGLNAPIPPGASFGYHPGGWGKPPVDEDGNPLYGDVFGLVGDTCCSSCRSVYCWRGHLYHACFHSCAHQCVLPV
jgi:hypothetical protein